MSPTATLTWTYREFDIFNPKSWVFDIVDIAQALSHQCRFNGHVNFYSVAEHCVRVSEILEEAGEFRNTVRLGLLHDAAEAYLGDIPGPWKSHVAIAGRPIEEVEREIELAIFNRFDAVFNEVEWDIVKAADKNAYHEEANCRPYPGKGWDPAESKTKFLLRYHELS